MKKLSLLFIGLLIPAIFLTSCDRGDDPNDPDDPTVATPKFELIKEYMLQNSMDINQIIGSKENGTFFVTAAPAAEDLTTFIGKFDIFDIRNNADFKNGHIEGAKNVAFGDLLTEAAAATKPILLVCYTGQTACYGTALLRLSGYSNTKALKWGMSGWNPEFSAKWDNNIGDVVNNYPNNWSQSAAPNAITFPEPEPPFTINSSDPAALLQDRIEQTLGKGLQGVTAEAVLSSPNSYFINNYFKEADYSAFGHIANAYRILPLTLTDGQYRNLDPDQTVVTYCYTGQTSAIITACLNVLGYDAKSILFGMNGLNNSNSAWTTNQWGGDSNPKSLEYVIEN